jgi:hypothetical protein
MGMIMQLASIFHLPRADRHRRAKAIRRRLVSLEAERRAKAELYEERELAFWREQQALFDEILEDGVWISRLRSAANTLEFEHEIIETEAAGWLAVQEPARIAA